MSEFPDTAYSAYQAAAGGDVAEAIAKGSEHLLRTLAHMPAGSSSMELLYIFDNKANGQNRVYIHGEKEFEIEEERKVNGIILHPKVEQDLKSLARELEEDYDLDP